MAETTVRRRSGGGLWFAVGVLVGLFAYSLALWWRGGAPLCGVVRKPQAASFEAAGVSVNLPPGWEQLRAGGYVLARPGGKSDERILAISHKAASSAGMRQILSPLVREGPGGFYESAEPLNPCFDAAWIQRGESEGSWNKAIVFRDKGKLEVRIESSGGEPRIREMLNWVACDLTVRP